MDRLAKKCVITSGIMHGTLVLLLIVGPAFLSSDSQPDTSQVLTFEADTALSSGAAVRGFGTPTPAEPKPPAPVPPTPTPPKPEPVVKTPEPHSDPKPVDPTPKPNPDSTEPSDKPRKPQISLIPIVRKPSTTPKPNTTAADEKAKAKAEADKAARTVQTALNNISRNASTGVDVTTPGVPTGSGPSVAAFNDILKSIYFNNWHEPSDVTSEDGVVKVTVTVARDGSVIASRISKSSGDAAVDRSVQRTLENVTFIKPFPEDWKESQRQFQLSFSLKAKRSAA